MSSHSKATWSSREHATAPSAGPKDAAGSLQERLTALAADRVSSASALACETAAHVLQWVFERPLEWSWTEARRDLDAGLAAWADDQAWRGPCARLLDSLRRAREFAEQGLTPREVYAEELGYWTASDEAGEAIWSGAPLAPGRRLLDPLAVREHALAGRGSFELARRERILVVPPAHWIQHALEAAWREGLEPRVVLGEGGPHREGLRLARGLAEAGLDVSVAYDAALVRQVDRVDRVWIGTEATDGRAFLAPAGTEAVLVRARALEIPVELFAARTERLPASQPLTEPCWGQRDQWMLWEHAPAGVEVLCQAHELVSLDLIGQVVSESGRHAPGRLPEVLAGTAIRSPRIPAEPRSPISPSLS